MIYDISQPVFGCAVFPGDPKPEKTKVMDIDRGDFCNLSSISMCAHNGTHIDSPYHFINDGKHIDEIPPEKYMGPAFVSSCEGDVSGSDAETILRQAKETKPGSEKRILIKGRATVTSEAAKVFADAGIYLIGNESQTVGPEDAPKEVHMILLGAEAVLLEGIRLGHIPNGAYYLSAAPLNLTGGDGAPCRAMLTDFPEFGI